MDIDEILNSTEDMDVLVSLMDLYITGTQEVEKKEENYKVKQEPIHTIYKEGIEKHVDEQCAAVCRACWEKNIFTRESIIEPNKIIIVLDKLNDKNERIFKELHEKDSIHYNYSKRNDAILTVAKTSENKKMSKELCNLVKPFELQDITSGYMNQKEFLMNICGCEKVEGLKEHTKNWNAQFIFDPRKMEKSFEDYLTEYNYGELYVPQEQRIYLDKFYLNAHRKYLKQERAL